MAIDAELQKDDSWKDQDKAAKLNRERAELEKETALLDELEKSIGDLFELAKITAEQPDAELEKEGAETLKKVGKKIDALEKLSFFTGEHDKSAALITISAGAGGTEAQDWAEMLLRMYLRYCEEMDWKTEMIDEQRGQEAGFKHVTFRAEGAYVYGNMKHEAGVHRLVRNSPFNADNLRQTSFALVDVIPEVEAVTAEIRPEDIEFSAFRSGGKGGQNVNKVSSAVRLRHIPTGLTVTSSTERSQVQNRQQAMALLVSKLEYMREKQQAKTLADVRGEVKSAEWGSQIRSYVLQPYQMVKDHRTGEETNNAQAVLDGDISRFIEAMIGKK